MMRTLIIKKPYLFKMTITHYGKLRFYVDFSHGQHAILLDTPRAAAYTIAKQTFLTRKRDLATT